MDKDNLNNFVKNFCKANWLPITLISLGVLIVLSTIGSIFFWIHWTIGLIYIGIVLFALGILWIFIKEELLEEIIKEYKNE